MFGRISWKFGMLPSVWIEFFVLRPLKIRHEDKPWNIWFPVPLRMFFAVWLLGRVFVSIRLSDRFFSHGHNISSNVFRHSAHTGSSATAFSFASSSGHLTAVTQQACVLLYLSLMLQRCFEATQMLSLFRIDYWFFFDRLLLPFTTDWTFSSMRFFTSDQRHSCFQSISVRGVSMLANTSMSICNWIVAVTNMLNNVAVPHKPHFCKHHCNTGSFWSCLHVEYVR